METGSNKSLYTLIAVVVFGIFLSLSYYLFQDQMKSTLASVLDKTSASTSHQQIAAEYYNENLLIDGTKVVDGPLVGGSGGLPTYPDTDGVDGREFIAYKNIAPIIDKFGVGVYTISFDLKTTKDGSILVYLLSGASKYSFWANVQGTTEWKRYSIVVNIVALDPSYIHYSPTTANLSFYGTYNTQVSPSVKNVKIQMGTADGVPIYEESPTSLIY